MLTFEPPPFANKQEIPDIRSVLNFMAANYHAGLDQTVCILSHQVAWIEVREPRGIFPNRDLSSVCYRVSVPAAQTVLIINDFGIDLSNDVFCTMT